MFGLTLGNILKAFAVLERQLGEFIAAQEGKIDVNDAKVKDLQAANNDLTQDANKARRVLDRVKALTE